MCAARRSAAFALALGLLSACASDTAPIGWLPAPRAVPGEGFGAWAQVRSQSHPQARVTDTDGELLAVDPDSVFVLVADQVAAVPVASLVNVKLTRFVSGAGGLGAWTFVGVLSTVSHGLVLILTAPLWTLVGSIASASESFVPQESVRSTEVAWLRPYARFPQGMPAGLDRASLTRRPIPRRR